MVGNLVFKIEKKMKGALGRAGTLTTAHGLIETPAFAVVGTQAAVKALTIDQLRAVGAQVVLGNTYHLYLEPGPALVKKAGGLGKFMGWSGPTMTDSGGFQVFSLGEAYGQRIGKVRSVNSLGPADFPAGKSAEVLAPSRSQRPRELAELPDNRKSSLGSTLAIIDDDGVTFRSHLDGSRHRFTPERSIQIQHQLGADIIFAFDVCTSPIMPKKRQEKMLALTHAWAARSLAEHNAGGKRSDLKNSQGPTLRSPQMLFGIVQGGRHRDLREKSARALAKMDFTGYGIGGSFDKKDIDTVVGWVNKILPAEKPRHLLGIGEPEDLFGAIEQGCDLFDCVAPTRLGRHGVIYTRQGKINIMRTKYRNDLRPIEEKCGCYVCMGGKRSDLKGAQGPTLKSPYSRAYLAHLFRARESLAGTLASIHNLYFIVNLVKNIRQSILDGNFSQFKATFLRKYRA